MSDDQNQKSTTKTYADNIDVSMHPLRVFKACFRLSAMSNQDVVLGIGESSIGKTAAIRQEAALHGYDLVSFSLESSERTDIAGLPYPDSEGQAIRYLKDGRIPVQGRKDEDKKVIVHLDEINRAENRVMNAAIQLWQDRLLGGEKLGKNVLLVSTMNPPNGEYNVSSEFTRDPAQRRRLTQVPIKHEIQETLSFFREPQSTVNIDFPEIELDHEFMQRIEKEPRHDLVVGFLQANPTVILDEDVRHAGKCYPQPNGWERLSHTMHLIEEKDLDVSSGLGRRAFKARVEGLIGRATAQDFMNYMENPGEAITAQEVIEEYHEEKDVYEEVQELIDTSQVMRLQILLKDVARYIFQEEFAEEWGDDDEMADELAERIANLYQDLNPHLRSLLKDKISEEGKSGGTFGVQCVKFLNACGRKEAWQEASKKEREKKQDFREMYSNEKDD